MGLMDGDIASLFGEVFGGLYPDGTLHSDVSEPVYDASGNITGYAGGGDVAIKVQRDTLSYAMRQDEGYVEGDAALIVLARSNGTEITVTTDHEITDYAGQRWKVMTANLDAAGSHWICRGRAA